MRKSTYIFIVAAILLAALIGGCGSDDEGNTTALTQAEFIKQADDICARVDREQISGFESYAKKNPQDASTTSGQEKIIGEVGLPPIKLEAEELNELGVPEGDEEQVEAIVAGIEDALSEAEDDPLSMTREPGGGPFVEVNKLALSYGMKSCSDAA